jgi:adenine/guanine phosphoribosyltransferase-like PRPP-binding protein
MHRNAREVYVPARRPGEAAGTADRVDVWPRPVFTPGEGGAERTLAARVREAVGPAPRPRGSDGGAGGRVAALFRAPEAAREVVERLAREALEHDCTLVVSAEPAGAVGAPVAVEAGLPLVLAGGAEGRPEGRAAPAPGGERGEGRDAAAFGAADRVLLVDGVADSGERMVRAARRVESAGARVAAAAVVAEVAGGGARDRMTDYNFLSITTLQ